MSHPIIILIASSIVVALAWLLRNKLAADRISRLNDRRRSGSRLVSPGALVEGSEEIPVALALTGSVLHYENEAMDASLDLDAVQEVEYDDELATGRHISRGKVLRLRCFSTVFEFVLPEEVVARWKAALPAHRMAG